MQTRARAHTEIGAFDAKTRFSEILRKVEKGQCFRITRRGRPVANLVPAAHESQESRTAAIDSLLHFPRVKGIDGDAVLEWIREGRK